MALNRLNPTSVLFSKEQPSVKKKQNFFDHDDDDDDDFETFEDDKDFAKMAVSFTASKDKNEAEESDEELGNPWGGSAYSFKDDKPNAPVKDPIAGPLRSKTSIQKQSEPEVFHPFCMRDKMNMSKFTETAQIVQTSTSKNEESGTATTSTRYEATTSSIENVVQKAKSEMTDAERNRMQAEIKELQKIVSSLRKQHKKTPQPAETVQQLMLNQPCVLELYKSLDGKMSLLDEAIKLGDGDALITVLLFLKKTLKYSIFVKEINCRPVAVQHIISFMKAHYEYDELIKLLRVLGRKEEAMMLEYKRAVTSSNTDSQINAINTCQRIYEATPGLTDIVSVLSEHQALLKRQVKIEIKDKRTQAEGKDQIMRLNPRRSITSSPLIETLHHCCFYHYGKDDETLGPVSLQKEFKLTGKQFEWTMIGARAALKKWGDLDTLFTSKVCQLCINHHKSWYGSNKQKSSLGFDKVVVILEQNNAPSDILDKYLALIEVPETRLSLATKLQCHKVAVETIVSMKDKQKLEEYRKHLERTHPVQALISQYLQNSQIKWR